MVCAMANDATLLGRTYQSNQLLTIKQVCQEYNIGKTMLYQMLASGQLRAVVIGKRGTRIRRGDIDNLVRTLRIYEPKHQGQQ
jgi:excisionase family DNA binding protein